MKAVILGAGFSTRMRKSGIETPKALIEVDGKEIIRHVLDQLIELKIETTIVTNDSFYPLFNDFLTKKYATQPNQIRLVNNGVKNPEDRLGAIQDLGVALDHAGWSDDTFVFASDTIASIRIDEFVQFCLKMNEIVNVIYDTGNIEVIRKKLGCVVTDEKNEHLITAFKEKPDEPQSTKTSVPFYFIPKRYLYLIKDFVVARPMADSPGEFVSWLIDEGQTVLAMAISRYYFDLADANALKQLRDEVSAGTARI